MHIHNANLNPAPLSAQRSESALAARRASETRKKLIGAASELDAEANLYDPLALAIAGAYAGSSQSGNDAKNSFARNHQAEDKAPVPSTEKSAVSGLISFWA